jgi:hypothetical protein
MASLFLAAFMAGAAVLALWVDVRFPQLAPQSFSRRFGAACLAFLALQLAPVALGSSIGAYMTIFGVLLPTFVFVFLTAAWLIRSMRDAAQAA